MAATRGYGIKTGKYRSGFEFTIAKQFEKAKVKFEYEPKNKKVEYKVEKLKKYIPDFYITKQGVIVETKGRLTTADRGKHKMLKEQYPGLDIRIVFQNANNKIYKGSKTTYGDWADKMGITWANKEVPLKWIKEFK